MARISYEAAYPGIDFLPRSRNWWAWLKGSPAECIHLDNHAEFVATVLPDTLYLRGKRAPRRDPARPEVTLCRACLRDMFTSEIAEYPGRVIAFEPDPEILTQYFFVAEADFEAAGLSPEVTAAIDKRLAQDLSRCVRCSQGARWLWFSREQVALAIRDEGPGFNPADIPAPTDPLNFSGESPAGRGLGPGYQT